MQRNAQAYVPRRSMLKEVAQDLRSVFNTPNRPAAENYLNQLIRKYERSAARLANWMEHAIPEGFAVFDFPVEHRWRIHTTNMLERLSQEIWHRTRVVNNFLNEASCLRLTSAVLIEFDEKWQTGRRYLNFEGSEGLQDT